MNLPIRPRRLRSSKARRNLASEHHLSPKNLMAPIFVHEKIVTRVEIESMPGVYQYPLSDLNEQVDEAIDVGLSAVMLFAVPTHRDALGSEATNPQGILTKAVKAAKQRAEDRVVIVADLCLDEFTDHGHCGVLDQVGEVDNDATLKRYQDMALTLAEAGADFVGTSGMMDGQVQAVRSALDSRGYTDVGILAYAAKYASAFYHPFRGAVDSQLRGNRLSYQQDWRNRKEAAREVSLDVAEGADIVMIKPALSYLDVISDASRSVNIPVAAYVVSGEYAMVEFAASQGLVDRRNAIMELLTSVRRAGATIICTYWAMEWARVLGESGDE